ncbi:MAG TPA: fumarylacetoacetate hydrolase family protein [Candidatus Limnocylindrales bacterium]|nr:fumarylacetoacetate hydrolase family protein [Candidatus Limnocylindrales bacterium]
MIDASTIVPGLLQSRLRHASAAPITESHPALSLDEAYSIQRALEGALVDRGERVIGWKVGLTNAAFQQNWGLGEPVAAFMLGSGVFSSGDAVPAGRFVGLGVEVEVAFLLRSDLAGPGVTSASALLAVEGAMPSFELVDFRYSGKPRGVDLVADGVYANAIVLGQPVTPVTGLDLALEGVVYEENGQIVATATAAEVLGNPLVSLAWLANTLGGQGRALRAGDVVLSGSISKIFRPKAGDSIRASFTRLGSVSCRFI